jgi:hypothetical protein
MLVAVFTASRLLAWAAGVRFDDSNLTWYWQFLDVELLRHDLVRSLWYLHAQPPLFNLLVGGVLKIAPEASGWVFAAMFLAGGLLLTMVAHATLTTLGVRPWLSAVLVGILIVGPACLLYENYLFYTYPTAILLAVATYPLVRSVREGSRAWGLAFGVVLSLVCLTRSLFHPVWLLAAFTVPYWPVRDLFPARRLIVMAIPALLLVGLLSGKNFILFGIPAGSSWLGMNLFSVAAARLPEGEVRALHDAGALSDLAVLAIEEGSPFVAIDRYPERFRRGPVTGVAALDALTKNAYHPVTHQRVPNFNHVSIPAISRQFLVDSLRLIGLHPGSYVRSVVDNLATFASPSDSFMSPSWSANATQLSTYGSVYNALFRGTVPRYSWDTSLASRLRGKSLLFVLVIPAALVLGSRLAWRRRSSDPAFVAVFAFSALTMSYVAVVSNTLNLGESQRMFFLVEPLIFLVLGLCLEALLGAPRTVAPHNG